MVCNFRIMLGLIGLAAVFVGSLATGADTPPPSSVTLRYSLSVGGAHLGRLVANFQVTDEGIQGRSETRAEGMASILLGGDLSETCGFEADGNRVISRSYVSSKKGRGAYEYATEFDWEARKIHFDNDVTLDMPEGYVVDNCNLWFAAALSRGPMLSEQPLYVVDATSQRIRGYQVSSVTEEMLDTVLMTLEEQTDVVLFLLEEQLVGPVMEAISKAGEFDKPGTGIAFTLGVDEVTGLGAAPGNGG